MPKANPLLIDTKKYQELRRLIYGAAGDEMKNSTDIAKVIGYKDWRTAQKFLQNPQSLPVERLNRLGRNLSIPIERLREAAIRY